MTFFNAETGQKLQILSGAVFVPISLTADQVHALRIADDDDDPECAFFDPVRNKWRKDGRFVGYGDGASLDEFPGPACYICRFTHTTDFVSRAQGCRMIDHFTLIFYNLFLCIPITAR